MAVIGFWSGSKKETGQTVSAAAVATQMAIEHNYKILLIDATFDDDTMERCFWSVNNKKDVVKALNKGKMDISSGAEGLISAVASNKATPEVVTNFTKVVFKNRLDVLCGLKTKIREEYMKTMMLYKDLVHTANKYYDLVFVDIEKTMKSDTTVALLEESDLIVYNFTKNLKQADEYLSNLQTHASVLKKHKIIPLLSNADDNTVYNVKNVTRYIGEKKDIDRVPYNPTFVKSISEAGLANFFLTTRVSGKVNDKNSELVSSVENVCQTIITRLEQLKYM